MNDATEALALVTATFRGVRYVLLIERADGWAVPGGAIEPGEESRWAAAHGLHEETGLILRSGRMWWALDASRDGVVVVWCDLGEVDALPEVQCKGDARRAQWIMIDAIGVTIVESMIFPAHREILGALG